MGITQVIFENEMPIPVQEMDWNNNIIGFCSPTSHGIKIMGTTKPHVIIDRQLRLIAEIWKTHNDKLYHKDIFEYIIFKASGTIIHELMHYFSGLFDWSDEDGIKMMEIRILAWMRLNEKETK